MAHTQGRLEGDGARLVVYQGGARQMTVDDYLTAMERWNTLLTEEAGDMTACPDCGCPEDDHRFGAAYQRLVAEDNGARRDGPNPCLNCLNCGRSGE